MSFCEFIMQLWDLRTCLHKLTLSGMTHIYVCRYLLARSNIFVEGL